MLNKHPELNLEFPSENWLKENGYTYIIRGAKVHGGLNAVREKLGQSVIRKSSAYIKDFENISRDLKVIIESQLDGRFPTLLWLNDHGYSYIVNAVRRHHGGMSAVIEKMGYDKIEPIKTQKQLETFLLNSEEAKTIGSLGSVTDDYMGIADLLIQVWPSRFPSASQLAKSLPGAVKKIGHSLQPFSMESARGISEKLHSLSPQVRYSLDNLLLSIAKDQYQKQFNSNPEETLLELNDYIAHKNPVQKLAKKTFSYFKSIYDFNIPGQGKMDGVK
jgi:hypothetical protein